MERIMLSEHSADVARMLAVYKDLIQQFADGHTSADDFESAYLSTFKSDSHQVRGPEFEVLDSLFADVDDYVADPQLRETVGGLDGGHLRLRARKAYDTLYG
jgi:hypothetical protein